MITINQKNQGHDKTFSDIAQGSFFVNKFGDLFIKESPIHALRIRDCHLATPAKEIAVFPVDVDIIWEYK